jgi:ribosomal protein S1
MIYRGKEIEILNRKTFFGKEIAEIKILSTGEIKSVPISELSDERVLHPDTVTKVGDRLKTEIIAIDPKDRKISLSVKAMKRREEKEAMESYSSNSAPRSSIADTLDPEVAARLGLIKNKSAAE